MKLFKIIPLAMALFSMCERGAIAQSITDPDGQETFGPYPYGLTSYHLPPASSIENPIKFSTWPDWTNRVSPVYPTDYINYGTVSVTSITPNFWANDLLGVSMNSIIIRPITLAVYNYVTGESTFMGNGFTLNGSFTNGSPNKQTFNTDIALSQPNHAFAVNAGSLHLGGNVSGDGASITKTGSGVLHINGLSTYSGATVVSEGKLVVDGTLQNTSLITIAANATLAGNGSIASQVDVAGNIAPGSSIGSIQTGQINFLATSALLFEYDSIMAEADLLNVNGDLNIAAGAALDLTDLAVVGQILEAGTKFTLISYAGEWDGGEFDGFADDSQFAFGGNQWLIDYNDTNGGANGGDYDSFVTLSVVPEPSAALLLISGMSLLMLRRRAAA